MNIHELVTTFDARTSRDARRCSAERQKRRSNRTRLDLSVFFDAQLSGVARRRAQSECCRSYQWVRFERRRATLFTSK
jgi:hypothetical protein